MRRRLCISLCGRAANFVARSAVVVPREQLDYTTDMPSVLGLLGAGAQADEIESFARPGVVRFRAVDPEFVGRSRGVISVLTDSPEFLTCAVVAAVGAPGLKRSLVAKWAGSVFRTVVAESAWVDRTAELRDGAVVGPLAAVSVRTLIGKHALVNISASVSHDTTIGDYATVSPGVHIAGHCVVGDGVFLGIGSSVLQGVRIVAGSTVGAGAVVVRNIDEPGVYVGVPARRIRATREWLDVL